MSLPPEPTPRRAVPGMTLLELVATLIVFSMLMTGLMQVFHGAIRNRETVITNLSVIDEAHGAMEILVRDLESMHTYDSRTYLMVDVQPFDEAEGTSIAFPTSTPVRVSEHFRERPGLVEIAYLVGPDPDTEGAMRVFRRELEIETDTAAQAIRLANEGLVLLVSGLSEFHMTFLSTDEAELAQEGGEPEFADRWESGFGTEKLPVAIEVVMTVGGHQAGAPMMTLTRTIRLPVADVSQQTLQEQLSASLGLE